MKQRFNTYVLLAILVILVLSLVISIRANPLIGSPDPTSASGYIIYTTTVGSTTTYYAKNGASGLTQFISANFTNLCRQIPQGCTWDLAAGVFVGSISINQSQTSIIGQGENQTIIVMPQGTYQNCIEAIGTAGKPLNNIVVKDLTVNGQWDKGLTNPTQGQPVVNERKQNGISLQYVDVANIEDVVSYNQPWNGIQAYYATHIAYNHCKAVQTYWHGFQFWDAVSYSTIEGCTAISCGLASGSLAGITVEQSGCVYDTVSGNIIQSCNWGIEIAGGGPESNCVVSDNSISTTSTCILLQNTYGVSVSGNTGQSASGNPIYLQGVSDCVVSGNTVTANYGHGVYSTGTTETIIANNVIVGANIWGKSGIYLSGTTYSQVTGNIINTFQDGTGISLDAGCQNNVLSQNRFDSVTRIISDSGTRTSIYENNGYNPVGYIANPINIAGGNLLVNSGSSATFVSGTTYTCWESPKVLYLSGGAGIAAVVVDGQTLYTSTTTCSIVLQPGDTFSVTASTMPTIKVLGQ